LAAVAQRDHPARRQYSFCAIACSFPTTHSPITPQPFRPQSTPPPPQFFEVTQIADAVALWKSLQERQKGGGEAEEEFEDDQVRGSVPPGLPVLVLMSYQV